MKKRWQQVAAVLGILLAGCAYLPVESSDPRAKKIIADSKCAAIVTTEGQTAHERVIFVRNACRFAPPTRLIQRDVEPSDTAYVIFTSGSTGVPKGVMIAHQSACNTIATINEMFAVGPADTVLSISALNFDLSVWDIFGVLGAGGRLVMCLAEEVRNAEYWWSCVQTHRRTMGMFTGGPFKLP